jgi:peptidoglycan/xylan/chitin deacetylase (PgdA/CDA1 family)
VAKAGFELGNHTLYHPCRFTSDNPVSSAGYTAFDMVREIEVMNWMLFAIDGKTARTYAYPCAETAVGGKDYVDTLRNYKPVKYARIGGDTGAVITDFAHLDLLRIPSLGLEDNASASELLSFVKRVQKSGGMGIIMFHGIGGDYISTSTAVHQELLDYLKKNSDTIWVPTFQQAMDYVVQQSALPHVQGY